MHFQHLIFVTIFEAYMAMHLVWKGRQLIVHLFNTVWILLLSGFLHMYMYSVCSYFYVYEYVYACVHVCVDAQSQLWMSTQWLYLPRQGVLLTLELATSS